MKRFHLYKERTRFILTVYLSNPFNRSYLSAPSGNISDFQNVGKTTRYGNRSISLGGRFEFELLVFSTRTPSKSRKSLR